MGNEIASQPLLLIYVSQCSFIKIDRQNRYEYFPKRYGY